MQITYACPACHATATLDGIEGRTILTCPSCAATIGVPDDAFTGGDAPRPRRCIVCPSTELFRRKDFPQRLGLAIVGAGLAASCVAWAWRELFLTFGILFGTAFADVVLYLLMPECLSCYRCGARYRGPGVGETFGGFDLATHEKHRQQAGRMRAGAHHGS